MIPAPVNFRYSNELQYRQWIEGALAEKATISFRHLGRDKLMQDFVYLSPDWRTVLEACSSSNPKWRMADLRRALLYFDSLIIEKIVCPNQGFDLRNQLVIEVADIDWISAEGEPFNVTAVLCSMGGKIIVASKYEVPVSSDEEYRVDHFLYICERARLLEQLKREPYYGPVSYED
jgi:hypothetical protein